MAVEYSVVMLHLVVVEGEAGGEVVVVVSALGVGVLGATVTDGVSLCW